MVNAKIFMTMKRIITVFAASLILAALSCSKQETFSGSEQNTYELVSVVFNAGKEGFSEPQSRSFIADDGTSVLWEATDKVRIFDNVAPATPHDFAVAPLDPATGATLTGEVADGSNDYYAVAPAAAGTSISGTDVSIMLASQQVIPAGKNISSAALVSVAHAAGGSAFEFKNVCGLLKVEVSYANVLSICIEGDKIAGPATVDGTTGVIKSSASATGSIEVTYEGGVFPKGVYYIAVLPGTTVSGNFSVSMKQDISGFSATRTATQAVPIPRNGGFDFKKLDSTLSWEYLISNADELLAWNARYAEWKATDVVKLTANIDMSGKEWTPRNFGGSFDGQNHSIYNLVVNASEGTPASLIWQLTGSLKNLVVGSQDGESKDGVSKFSLSIANDADYRFAALVNSTSGSASMENVKNFADVEISSATSATRMFRAGGICAQWSSTGGCTSCINYGDVTIDSEVEPAEVNGSIAGILSFVNEDIAVSNCKNYGSVVCNNSYVGSAGGIVGNANTGSAIIISGCENYGDVVSNAVTITNKNAINIAGIAAQINKAGASISDSDNHGAITHSISSQTANSDNLGGIVGYMSYGTVDNCDNYAPVTSKVSASYEGSQQFKFNGNTNVGGIVGYANTNACLIKNCDNKKGTYTNGVSYEAKVSNLAGNAQCMLGGIVGKINAGATNVTDCNNYAEVVNSGDIKYCYFGGIIGRYDGPGTVSGCLNQGNVSTTGPTTTAGGLRMGGIVGASNKTITIDACTNKANVTNSTAISVNHGIGGVFGHPTGANAKIQNCKFFGNVNDVSTSGKFLGALIGWLPQNITLNNNGVGGTVGGVTLNADNYGDYLYVMEGSRTVTISTPNYYWNGE